MKGNHRLFTIEAFGKKFTVYLDATTYGNGTLAVLATAIYPDGMEEPFGVLTVNLPSPYDQFAGKNRAFVKFYSENTDWVDHLVNECGIAKPILHEGRLVVVPTGHMAVPLYEFDVEAFYEK